MQYTYTCITLDVYTYIHTHHLDTTTTPIYRCNIHKLYLRSRLHMRCVYVFMFSYKYYISSRFEAITILLYKIFYMEAMNFRREFGNIIYRRMYIIYRCMRIKPTVSGYILCTYTKFYVRAYIIMCTRCAVIG